MAANPITDAQINELAQSAVIEHEAPAVPRQMPFVPCVIVHSSKDPVGQTTEVLHACSSGSAQPPESTHSPAVEGFAGLRQHTLEAQSAGTAHAARVPAGHVDRHVPVLPAADALDTQHLSPAGHSAGNSHEEPEPELVPDPDPLIDPELDPDEPLDCEPEDAVDPEPDPVPLPVASHTPSLVLHAVPAGHVVSALEHRWSGKSPPQAPRHTPAEGFAFRAQHWLGPVAPPQSAGATQNT